MRKDVDCGVGNLRAECALDVKRQLFLVQLVCDTDETRDFRKLWVKIADFVINIVALCGSKAERNILQMDRLFLNDIDAFVHKTDGEVRADAANCT